MVENSEKLGLVREFYTGFNVNDFFFFLYIFRSRFRHNRKSTILVLCLDKIAMVILYFTRYFKHVEYIMSEVSTRVCNTAIYNFL